MVLGSDHACTQLPLYRRRAGILCFRRTWADGKASEIDSAFEFLLVGCHSGARGSGVAEVRHEKYTIPAARFESSMDSSCEDCAVREALEGAGVGCHIAADLGWHASSSQPHGELIQTRYFLCCCEHLLDRWEDGSRERLWLPPTAALQALSYNQDLVEVVSKGHETLRNRAGCDATLMQSTIPTGQQQLFHANSDMKDAVVQDADSERFLLYSHQVGGHSRMVKPVPGSRLEVELPLRRHQRQRCETAGSEQELAKSSFSSGEICHISSGNILLKPLNENEAQFYCHTLSDDRFSGLRPFVPLFYGTKKLNREQIEVLAFGCMGATDKLSGGHLPPDVDRADRGSQQSSAHMSRYLVLEDLGGSASQPCFLDLKVGCRQRSVRHNAQKQAHMAKKAAQTTSATVGFRVCGMQFFDHRSGQVQRFDKYWGQNVTLESMSKTLAMFFSLCLNTVPGPLVGVHAALVQAVVDKLVRLESILQQLPGKRFWGSSLLIFFDAGAAEKGDLEGCLSSVQVKIIDFANFHNVGGNSPDLEYLCGINNARMFLQELLHGQLLELVPPPPAEVQDLEQENARQLFRFSETTPICPGSTRAIDVADDDGCLASNAQTVSGATGRTLMREIAPRHMVTHG